MRHTHTRPNLYTCVELKSDNRTTALPQLAHQGLLLQTCAVQGGEDSWALLLALIRQRVVYCLAQYRALPVGPSLAEEVSLLAALGQAQAASGQLQAAAGRPGQPRSTSGRSGEAQAGLGLGMLPAASWQHHLRLVLELLMQAAGNEADEQSSACGRRSPHRLGLHATAAVSMCGSKPLPSTACCIGPAS